MTVEEHINLALYQNKDFFHTLVKKVHFIIINMLLFFSFRIILLNIFLATLKKANQTSKLNANMYIHMYISIHILRCRTQIKRLLNFTTVIMQLTPYVSHMLKLKLIRVNKVHFHFNVYSYFGPVLRKTRLSSSTTTLHTKLDFY